MPANEPISPELALVDPDLAARLRSAMTVEHVVQATIASPVVSPRAPTAAEQSAPTPPDRPHARYRPVRLRAARVAHASTIGITVLLLMLPFLAFLPPRQEPSLAASAASPSANPARTLSWPADRNATYYVAQLLRQHRLVYVTLPVTPTVILPGSLLGGSYVWRVYAGYGPIDENRRRGPIAQGTFTVGVD